MADSVLEISPSSHVNILTVLLRDGKRSLTCVDTRKTNRYSLPDTARVLPIQELLQLFHCSKFISSIDLSSAFLQIGLKKKSRKCASFLFDCQLHQFTRCPYSFKNLLLAFVRALKLPVGSDTYEHTLVYVDDISVHSANFELHFKHLNIVMRRRTRTGSAVNAVKYNFCKTEFSLSGASDQTRLSIT